MYPITIKNKVKYLSRVNGCYPDKDPNLASSYFCMSDRRIKLPNFTLELRSELKRAGEQAIPVNARDFYKDIFQDDLQEK